MLTRSLGIGSACIRDELRSKEFKPARMVISG
jgi:hypothetical protein